ncbi:MAG: PIG-L family deacetylase [Phycisphaerae bacterium]|nr:PIG-L family deacetylase [Phycisphaerae bacterium]
MYDKGFHSCAVIVAHPDDETLWAGGTILMDSRVDWTVITLCRASDPERAPRFYRAIEALGARGAMGNLDDGPEQKPLPAEDVQQTVLTLLTERRFDLILTHGRRGEYTRHRRHEETARAVAGLISDGRLAAAHAWAFAYEDGRGRYLPQPIRKPNMLVALPEAVWQRKYHIMTVVYGFAPDSFEARTTPRKEAFRQLQTEKRISKQRQHHESTRAL